MDSREKDIQDLCKQILDVSVDFFDNPNGAYESSCPFCSAEEHRGGKHPKDYIAKMSELEHEQGCAYLIAKDLSTGF